MKVLKTKSVIEMKTTRGLVFFVDREDEERVSRHRWWAGTKRNWNRIHTKLGRKNIPIHRFIMGAKPGQIVDHINCNPLDCRKSNLRFVDAHQNQWNRPPSKRYTPYKGITFRESAKRWIAVISKNKKTKYLGCFKTEIEAAQCYNAAAKKLFGDYAYLNKI